jgi:diguanylate cyclase (GGDEF)-like protein
MLCTILGIIFVMLARIVTAIVDPPQIGIYTYSPIQALYLATYSFGVLLLSISGILLASEQLRKEMERLLKFDALTGALTRRAALEYGEEELSRIRRSGTDFSVLMVDVDHFKKINDQYGHQVGDGVLIDVVRKAEQTLRSPAAIGRYGGEEFLVLLPNTNREQAVQIAQRMQHHLVDELVHPKVTISVGVASVASSDTLKTLVDDNYLGRLTTTMLAG